MVFLPAFDVADVRGGASLLVERGLGEVGAADGAGQVFEAPGVNAGGVEVVFARRLSYHFRQFYLHEADGADGAVGSKFVSCEDRHEVLEVFDVVVVEGYANGWLHGCGSATHALAVDEDADAHDDDYCYDCDQGN